MKKRIQTYTQWQALCKVNKIIISKKSLCYFLKLSELQNVRSKGKKRKINKYKSTKNAHKNGHNAKH